MTSPARITQAAITRAIKAATAAGLEIGEVMVTAAGDVRIIPAGAAPADDFEAWRRDNAKRTDTATVTRTQGGSHRPAKAG